MEIENAIYVTGIHYYNTYFQITGITDKFSEISDIVDKTKSEIILNDIDGYAETRIYHKNRFYNFNSETKWNEC